ncbi:MAG: FtsQ-type POTRA domain-containing protein [Pseudomonadota bacterium]|nr:FtsQ-type POTRA domain-containing protein [Pseudomonadota bacterium]
MILPRSEKSKQRGRISNNRADVRRARRPQSKSSNRKLLLFLAFSCLSGLGGGALWLWWPTLVAGTNGWLKGRDDLLVKEIIVHGNCRSSRLEIVKVLGLAPRQLIFTFDLKKAQDRVDALPFIEETRIRRRWPDRLEIMVKERQPKALLYLDKLYLVDEKGRVIAPVPEAERLDFPLINGVSMAQWKNQPEVWSRLLNKALDLLNIWEKKGREWPEKVAQIGLDEVCGLTVFTTDMVWELQLGLESFDERLERWRQVLKVLGERSMAVKYFDCTGTGSVVVGLRPQTIKDDERAEEHGQK